MATESYCLRVQVCFLSSLLVLLSPIHASASLNRHSFPTGFIFGTASSAYQYEGAAYEGGRGPSIWDTFTQKYPEKIKDCSNGNVTVDFYHRYKEDIAQMKKMNLDAFRLSISWSRILPSGKLSGGVNKEGIKFYNNLIDELLINGIQPFVTLFHWDLPQPLEDEYGGFLNHHIVDDFRDYAEFCFREFGDRVRHWITLNEPSMFSRGGYATGMLSPGRCSSWQNLNCTGGDSGTEPYLVAHHQLLAHAAVVQVYRQKFQARQKGRIGITLVSQWFLPYSEDKKDRDAAQRALDFTTGWFMDPLSNGDYPLSMQAILKDRLPKFSEKQSELLRGSFDFVGLNYYTSYYASSSPLRRNGEQSYLTDSLANISSIRNGIPIGPKAASEWFYVYPKGIYDMLLHIKKKYNSPFIYITENGVNEANNVSLSLKEALNDTLRVDFHYNHLLYLQKAIKNGVDVRGYFVWSLLDDFEWASGYTVRFGINYVDYENGLKRYSKKSARWFTRFLK